jgi:hypothetical protein
MLQDLDKFFPAVKSLEKQKYKMDLLKRKGLPYVGSLGVWTYYILYSILLFKPGQSLGYCLRNFEDITHD